MVRNRPNDKVYLAYLPSPTELCLLCRPRTKKGRAPACVKHGMAECLTDGAVVDLAKEMAKKPRMVPWAPR